MITYTTPEPTKVENASTAVHRPPVTYYARAAGVVAFGVHAGLQAVGVLVMWAVNTVIPPVPLIAVAVSIMLWGYLTYKWTGAGAVKRPWEFEDAAHYWRVVYPNIAEEEAAVAEQVPIEGLQAEIAGWRVLAMHYVGGRSATRRECAEAGISQGAWNRANAVLKRIGVKGERAWMVTEFAEACRRYEAVRFDADGRRAWIKTPVGVEGLALNDYED